MPSVVIDGPHRNGPFGATWDVQCGGATFSVSFVPAVGPEKDAGDWVGTIATNERNFGKVGITKKGALTATIAEVRKVGALPRVDWNAVVDALTKADALR